MTALSSGSSPRLLRLLAAASVAAFLLCLGETSHARAESTALCEVHASPCPPGDLASTLHFVDPTMKILSNIVDVECEALLSATVTTNSLLGTQLIFDGALDYTNCDQGCSITQTTNDVIGSLLKNGEELAGLTTVFRHLMVCGLIYHCVHDGFEMVGHVLGPLILGSTRITYVEQPLVPIEGFLCPEEVRLDAFFESLELLFVAT